MKKLTLLFLCCIPLRLHAVVDFSSPEVIEERKKEGAEKLKEGHEIWEKFYKLPEGCASKDITEDIRQDSETEEGVTNAISNGRHYVLFEYSSDRYQVKAVIGYTPDEVEEAPLLMFLRGGNRCLWLPHPGKIDNHGLHKYTLLAPVYRGLHYDAEIGGCDEYGGEEVNDIPNLVNYIPELERQLAIKIRPKRKYILGQSRGGMEMFLALQRHPRLQDWFDKAVSLSGGSDLRQAMKDRPEMRETFKMYGLTDENENEWLEHRSALKHCDKLKGTFPIFLIHGGEDSRAPVSQGRQMWEKLKELGKTVEYWEAENGNHDLSNMIADRNAKIIEWLES